MNVSTSHNTGSSRLRRGRSWPRTVNPPEVGHSPPRPSLTLSFPRLATSAVLGLFWVLFLPETTTAGSEAGHFQTAQYKEMEYQLFKPENLASGDRAPLIIGLHGVGRRTVEISKLLLNFHQIPARPDFQAQYPCYILAPKTTKSWFPGVVKDPELSSEEIADLPPFWRERYDGTVKRINNPPPGGFGDQEILLELIDKVIAENTIDPERIYVVGFSMGGSGTWQTIAARPGFFAAAVPVAGNGLFPWQWNAEVLSVPIWAFHGTADKTTVPEMHSTLFAFAREIGGNMKYTEFEGANHAILENVFTPSGEIEFHGPLKTFLSSENCDAEANLWRWLFTKRRAGGASGE